VSTHYLNNTVYAASNPFGGTLTIQGLKIDEATKSQTASNDRFDYITGILKSRNLMYGNRDIVNGQDEAYDEYLSQGYILDKLNKINVSSDFNTNNVDNTSTTLFVVVDKNGEIAS